MTASEAADERRADDDLHFSLEQLLVKISTMMLSGAERLIFAHAIWPARPTSRAKVLRSRCQQQVQASFDDFRWLILSPARWRFRRAS